MNDYERIAGVIRYLDESHTDQPDLTLLQIQHGTLVSYGGLAATVDQPTAARAVGSAVEQNPLAYLIPCHRVIRETGVLGNYRWGPVRKRAILAWENAPRFAAKTRRSA